MRLFREEKGHTAYTIVESDERLPEGVDQLLLANPNINDVMVVQRKEGRAMNMDFKSAKELLDLCEETNCHSEVMRSGNACWAKRPGMLWITAWQRHGRSCTLLPPSR